MHETVQYFNLVSRKKNAGYTGRGISIAQTQCITVMNALKIIGIILIIIGVAMLATGGFHFKEKKKILDTDAIDISRTETKIVTWPRIAGVVVIVGGLALLLLNRNDKGSVA
ncbi:MAG TPA: hypothetical protein VNT20_15790 [Flavisolibacter sp.]|nr:hypothetical protein [Flavisolibacter sp.]